ncbi:XRE family transcriptional regulator [Variovorax sp. WS11]|uniref:helix-turn-helix domain-containing protein n=1 Tax=Variovorax sp. WS11 TaxID=1105204 RepID=UPI000D0D6C85|nr:helix-turn-helix domain-containing protein [Variovorax sp. WS11]NDZ13152.1 helix-turn-helix domain-containing protein [Variovorax sp. WS11]PSL79681.1 XRE family transcriptional regulator [Variovorax sp. WS11]
MPASGPDLTAQSAGALSAIGATVRRRRKDLGISAVAAAEAAGISRVTLHRIEKGEPAVTMGAYLRVLVALSLQVAVLPQEEAVEPHEATRREGWLPARVRIADYPWLKELAWQVHGAQELTPREALGIYERNWRHVDPATLSAAERELVDALRLALGSDPVV